MNQRAAVSEMPQHERPLSELFRIAANAWVAADAKARELDAMKDLVLAKRKSLLILEATARFEKLSDAAAEREVKSSDEWMEYITGMVHAKTIANTHKVEMERIRMREREVADHNANIRADMRFTR